jgi:hypothetical protein
MSRKPILHPVYLYTVTSNLILGVKNREPTEGTVAIKFETL